MQPADLPTTEAAAEAINRTSRGPISVALLAGLACVPIVVAVGFLTDHAEGVSVPSDISVVALRGRLEGGETAQLKITIRGRD